ncbi:MAG: acetolactate synthase small subunit [Clostridiales bacterium]|nr:acetolactate synthase small subunit [Clostridiales bacterium]
MNRHILSILVENQPGVLSRVTGLFSRRSYNIDSLSVSVAESDDVSRVTVVVTGDDGIIDQITRQLEKLIDVRDVTELTADSSVYRELALVKVSAEASVRPEIMVLSNIFAAKVIDVAGGAMTVEITGSQGKIDAFLEQVSPYGVLEMARTGLTGLPRGGKRAIR